MLEKLKKIVAVAGVLLLLNMYLISLLFAFMKASFAKDWLMASLLTTIVVPVLLYAIILIQRVLKNKKDE